MRMRTERVDTELLETFRAGSYNQLVGEAYESPALQHRATANTTSDSLDFGTLQDLYGSSFRTSSPHRYDSEDVVFSRSVGSVSRIRAIDSGKASESSSQTNENSQDSETPGQVDSMPENTPANFNVETPSSGYADEAPESNTNSTQGFPDTDAVPTENQAVPVAMAAVANSTAFSPCCNSTNQAETVSPDPEGLNVEGETEGSGTAASDSSNSNASANDAEGDNGSDGNSGGTNGTGDGDGGDGGD